MHIYDQSQTITQLSASASPFLIKQTSATEVLLVQHTINVIRLLNLKNEKNLIECEQTKRGVINVFLFLF